MPTPPGVATPLAWLVVAEGDMTAQDTHKVGQLEKHPYEQLLQEVKTRLGE